jgi:hypothetical protein
LKDVLTPQVELIYELKSLSLEVDPVKVSMVQDWQRDANIIGAWSWWFNF